MEGADESTELWRYPSKQIKLLNVKIDVRSYATHTTFEPNLVNKFEHFITMLC